jgi:hypothetical protein
VLIVTSSTLLLGPLWLTLTFDALAIASAVLAAARRVTLTVHAAAYLMAAAVVSGLLVATSRALGGQMTEPVTFSAAALTTLAALAVCWTRTQSAGATRQAQELVPRLVIAALLVACTAGWLVSLATALMTTIAGAPADPGAVATVRTTVLAGAAIALAWIGRRAQFRESLWLLYPLLAAGALKLLLEDFPVSKPQTLFVALAVYGGALIAAPRLSRR